MTAAGSSGRHRLPAMTLRRRLVIAFAGLVTVAVVLVGGITYSATVNTLNAELDRALVSAATTIAAGGTVPTGDQIDDQGQQHGSHNDRDTTGAIISVVQHIAADGTVSHLSGDSTTVPIDTAELNLAALGSAGDGRYDQVTVGDTTYRVYTLAQGGGAGAIQVGRDTADSARILTRIGLITAAVGLAVILLAALAGWWIARQITRRLTALSDAAEQVARTGDLGVPIEAKGRDEVGRLGASLRSMLTQLGESRDAQRRLVQNAGHELRTPITSLRTNARVLRRVAELPDSDRRRLLDDVDSELKELTGLVNELVELATDTYSVEPPEPTDLTEVVNRVAARIGRRSGRSVLVDGDGMVLSVRPHAVERAVGNLIENAVKFDPGGSAPIEATIRGARITVADRGPGVPADDLDRIFDRFYRADTARSLPGSGLGLAIVGEVAGQHGGTVTAHPRPGGGLVVELTLTSVAASTASSQPDRS